MSNTDPPVAAGFAPIEVTDPSTRVGQYRWVICALLFFATTINYIDRQILSLLKEILDKELGWTNEQFGMVNSAFQAAYAVGLLGFGWFIDRFGTKIGYAVSIAAWSVAAAGHALVGSVQGFFNARVALGLGEAGNFPAAIKAVALWFPKRERAFATSIFNSGTNVGAIIAPAVIPWVAFNWGWRAAFVAAGIAGFAWLLCWLPFYDVPEKIRHLSAGELAHIRSDAAFVFGSVNRPVSVITATYRLIAASAPIGNPPCRSSRYTISAVEDASGSTSSRFALCVPGW